jgi:hypothetical protein
VGFLKTSLRQGMLVGVSIPVCLLGIALLLFDSQQKQISIDSLAALCALCALPNMGLFFFAIRKDKDVFAYGILWGCILWALFTFGLKLFG